MARCRWCDLLFESPELCVCVDRWECWRHHFCSEDCAKDSGWLDFVGEEVSNG